MKRCILLVIFIVIFSCSGIPIIDFPGSVPPAEVTPVDIELVPNNIIPVQENRSSQTTHLLVFYDNIEDLLKANIPPPLKVYRNLRAAIFETDSISYQIVTNQFKGNVYHIPKLFQNAEVPRLKHSDTLVSALTENPKATLHGILPLWERGYNGTGMVIGIVDTGVEFSLPALSHAFHKYKIFSPPDIPGDKLHGTMVASVMVSNGTGYPDPDYAKGVAFGAKLAVAELGIKDWNIYGDFIGAFDWMIGLPEVDVINFSIGSSINWIEPVIRRIEGANKFLVASAGNEGRGGAEFDDPYSVTAPASSPHAIGVGGINPDKTMYEASSEGPGDLGIMKPDLVAQATDVLSMDNTGRYFKWMGTSFASPIVASSIALLISALEAEGVNWTVATIKAALMRTATDLGFSHYKQGMGLINASKAFDYLMSLPRDNNGIPVTFEVTPKTGYPEELKKIPVGEELALPVTVITNQLQNVAFELQGNFSDFSEIDIPYSDGYYSHEVKVRVKPTELNQTGFYSGLLKVSLLNETMTVPISFEVLDPPSKRIYLDGYYTYADDLLAFGLASDYTGAVSSILMDEGYWFELKNEQFSLETLRNYDALVMVFPFMYSTEYPAPVLATDELNALFMFLEQGGGLLMFGDSLDPDVLKDQLEMITTPFGVTFSPTLPEELLLNEREAFFHLNSTAISRTAKSIISGYGEMRVEPPGKILAVDENGAIVLAYGTTENYVGRAVFSSSVHFMKTNYLDMEVPFPNSREFIVDLFCFLTNDNRISLVNETLNEKEAEMVVRVIRNGTPVDIEPSVSMRKAPVQSMNYSIEHLLNGYFRVKWTIPQDGLYEPVLTFEDDYISSRFIVDTTPPIITGDKRNPSNVSIDKELVVMNFFAEDEFGIDWNSLQVTLDGSTNGLTIYNSSARITISFSPSSLSPSEIHSLNIKLKDLHGNEGNMSFTFTTYDPTPDVPSTTSTEEDTSSSISVPSSTIQDNPLHLGPLGIPIVIHFLRRRRPLKLRNDEEMLKSG